jgi:LysR family transcriptional regulator, hypochlorite-specific transcription factor HypT
MQMRWVEDFLTLAEARGFARAASRRNMTQPTFSRHIQSLEEWLGVELVDRRVQGVQLTPQGRMFREFAIDMLRRTYDMRSMLRGQTPVTKSLVRFSVSHTLSVNYFPEWLNRLQAELGHMVARVNAVNIPEGALAMTEGATDLLLAYHHPQLPVLLDPERFPHLVLGMQRMVPVSAPLKNGAPKFRLPGTPDKPVPFLSYSAGAYLGQAVEIILLLAGQPAHLVRTFDTHMAESLKAMMLAGHGVGWLPQHSAGRELEEKRLVLAGPQRWTCDLELRLYRSAEPSNDWVERIWQQQKAQAAGGEAGRASFRPPAAHGRPTA